MEHQGPTATSAAYSPPVEGWTAKPDGVVCSSAFQLVRWFGTIGCVTDSPSSFAAATFQREVDSLEAIPHSSCCDDCRSRHRHRIARLLRRSSRQGPGGQRQLPAPGHRHPEPGDQGESGVYRRRAERGASHRGRVADRQGREIGSGCAFRKAEDGFHGIGEGNGGFGERDQKLVPDIVAPARSGSDELSNVCWSRGQGVDFRLSRAVWRRRFFFTECVHRCRRRVHQSTESRRCRSDPLDGAAISRRYLPVGRP